MGVAGSLFFIVQTGKGRGNRAEMRSEAYASVNSKSQNQKKNYCRLINRCNFFSSNVL